MGKIIGLDTSIFIYLLENNTEFADRCEKIIEQVQFDGYHAIFASIGLIEIYTGPKRTGDVEQIHYCRNYITQLPNLIVANLNEPVIDIASDLRAKYKITVPDAIHIASAIVYGADTFITNDKALKKVKEISIQLL